MPISAVTGAFGYSGRYIARRLIDRGDKVVTLTSHPGKVNPFGDAIKIAPLDFADPEGLARSLKGASVLFCTYWIRFPYGDITHPRAVENSRILFEAARQAGVGRVVHTSIANPSLDSKLSYYKGKAQVEQCLIDTGLSYAIMRPTVLFGGSKPAEDVLINNIAWLLRRFPVFGMPGDGQYGIHPIHVEDLADLALRLADEQENVIMDAVGPEAFTFEELLKLVKHAVGSRALIVPMPKGVALAAAAVLGWLLGDVMLTREEVIGLTENLLYSGGPRSGKVRLSRWLTENAGLIGIRYASEVGRHFK
jgi:nucleoside-diphosphate-sugar epimerase